MKAFRILIFSFVLIFSYSYSTAQDLSSKATISLLIASPNPEEIVSTYGHTLLRVHDPELKLDYVFNYGTFDQSLTGFQTITGILRSELKYDIWVMPFTEYYQATKKIKRGLVEHTFNFSAEEKKAIWQNLIAIVKNKDQKYTFDFFNQNCTTFARDLITYNLGKKIVLPNDLGHKIYRDINLKYDKDKLWYTFTIDLIFGNDFENKVPAYQSLYDPKELESGWSKSFIADSNGNKKALFASTFILLKGRTFKETSTPLLLSPTFLSAVLLLIILGCSLLEWKNRSYFKWFDMVIFGIAGILGIAFYLFKILCNSWYVMMDWDILWLHPFHLLVILFAIKSFNKSLFVYHFINSIVLIIFMAITIISFQPYNTAVILLTAGLLIRSVTFLFREKYQIAVRTK